MVLLGEAGPQIVTEKMPSSVLYVLFLKLGD